jgi:glycerol kinase
MESWLAFKLTGGAHITDAANASRTSLLPLGRESWDVGLCDLFGVLINALAEVVDNAGAFGAALPQWFGEAIPLTGLAGDQQSAAIGQCCLSPGDTKATYGTGAFVLANMGDAVPRSRHRLLGTVLCQLGGARTYALEGSIFVAGSLVQWLRDSLGLVASAAETEALARSVPDSGGLVIVPALSGLGAPHWRPDARASITGATFATTRAHVVRAALEAMALQTHDLAAAFAGDGARWTSLRIDGGMSANDWIAQDLADMLDLPVERPGFVETTALGAAMLAGLGAGLFGSLDEACRAMRGAVSRFDPQMQRAQRDARLALWRAALTKI